MSRIRDFSRGIVSLALIVALLVGVPALLLVIVGFPLPTETPSIELIRSHLADGDIPDLFVVKTLAVVVWLVWIQLAIAVSTETVALLRGRASSAAPVLPAVQQLAGKLVASTVLIVSAFSPPRSAAAVPITPIQAAELTVEPGPSAGHVPVATAFAAVDGPPSAGGVDWGTTLTMTAADGVYRTRSGDSWWDMAERLLGDGMRWSELRDLNAGRTMLTGEVVSEQTESVSGGWRLAVPADADANLLEPIDAGDRGARHVAASSPLVEAMKPAMLVFEGPSGVVDAGPGVPYQVVEGDNLWDIAEQHLGDPFRWPEIFERSKDLTQSFGRRITDPNLIWPDSILWLPTDATGVPPADPELVRDVVGTIPDNGSSGPTAVRPEDLDRAVADAADALATLDGGPDDPRGPGGHDGHARSGNGSRPERPEPARLHDGAGPNRDDTTGAGPGDVTTGRVALAFGAGGLLVATGLLGLLQRARKLRRSEAGERSRPAPPPLELVDLETVLRNSSDGRRAGSVHAAISSLADRPIIPDEPVAAPEVVRISRDRIEVVQLGPDPHLPAPWASGDASEIAGLGDRSVAVLPAECFPEPAGDGADDLPAPTCVTVGGGLLVNLETAGVVAIDGPVEAAAGLVRSMVHELATGPARRSIDIRVSDWLPGADLHDHVRCGPLDNLAGELEPWLEDVELGLTASGGFSAYALRAAGLGRSLPDPKVIFAEAADAANLGLLVERARRHSFPLAVVLSGDLDGTGIEPAITLSLDADTVRLEPHGFTAAVQYLDVDLIVGAEELIDHARRAPMVRRDDDQPTILPLSDHDTDPAQVATEETPQREIATELPAEEEEVTDQATTVDVGVLIRVLGPVELDGGPADLTEEEQSLLTFLALVGPSTAEQVRDAVWPGGGIDDERFDEIVARLRARLGQWFPDTGDGRLRVRSIVTDLGAARRWITQAGAMSGERARNLMQLALSDVRGEPFSGVSEHHWQWIDDHKLAIGTQASTMLIDACFDLCDSAYDANDVHLAKWACDVAALVDPLHETVATRRVQLLQILDERPAATAVVEEWEARFERTAGRPAPPGVRSALRPAEASPPHVS